MDRFLEPKCPAPPRGTENILRANLPFPGRSAVSLSRVAGHRLLPLLGGLLALWGVTASAQWLTQEVPLRAGWNAVHLEVQPLPAECERQLAGTPVTQVHRFAQRVRVAQFHADPSKPFRRPAEWLSWRPEDGTNGYLRTLANLTGDTAYRVASARVRERMALPTLPHEGPRCVFRRLAGARRVQFSQDRDGSVQILARGRRPNSKASGIAGHIGEAAGTCLKSEPTSQTPLAPEFHT